MPGAETEQKTETPAVEEKTPVEQMKEKVAEEGKHCLIKALLVLTPDKIHSQKRRRKN